VRTIREFFDTMNAGGAEGFQRLVDLSGGPIADDGDYDRDDIEGSRSRPPKGRSKRWERAGFASDLLSDPGGAVIDSALGFAGRVISRGAKKIVSEQVVPAVQAHLARAQSTNAEQQFAQARADQDAIVARYPELRTCNKDLVVYLDGGSRTVPVSEIPVPLTLTQADAVVARLR
jgi:hypothetical protein